VNEDRLSGGVRNEGAQFRTQSSERPDSVHSVIRAVNG